MPSPWFSFILVAAMGASGCRANNATSLSRDPSSNRASVQDQAAKTSQPTTPEPASPAADTRPILVCFGDSLTAGFGADVGESYPDFLQGDLDARGFRYRVVNEGISGNTTKDGLDRVGHVLSLHPAVVVVEFGGNDGLRGLRIEDTRSNLDAILARLKPSGARIALAGITLPPDYGPDYIRQFQATYAVLAKKYSVPLLPFLLQGVFGVDGMMQPDRTHATARGNAVVARNVLQLVTPLLRKPS